MEPRELVRRTLELRQTNPTRLLRDHNISKFQPTFSKWLNHKVTDPRQHWIAPVAKALGIKPAAMTDDSIAEEEATRLGLRTLQAAEPAASYAKRGPRQARIDPGTIAIQIGDLMRGFDPDLREAAAPLFKIAAAQPDRATEVAEKLRQLLSSPTADEGKRTGTHG